MLETELFNKLITYVTKTQLLGVWNYVIYGSYSNIYTFKIDKAYYTIRKGYDIGTYIIIIDAKYICSLEDNKILVKDLITKNIILERDNILEHLEYVYLKLLEAKLKYC